MTDLVRILGMRPEVNTTVIDRTGLIGNFDFTIGGAPEPMGPIKPLLESQLGLTLRPAEGPVEGQTLSGQPGTWSNTPSAFSYQWQSAVSYADAVGSDGPGGYWRLGEAVGVTSSADLSESPHPGSYSGGVTLGAAGLLASDALNTAASFNGTSGTVTTLASVHLALPAYDRRAVDGLHVPVDAMQKISAMIAGMEHCERAALPCIGRDRADLVVAGCAILEAIVEIWPAKKLGVADRGIREGILRSLMAKDGHLL